MSRPKCYDPEEGCYAQLISRNTKYDREWEHLDYAVDVSDLYHLLSNYSDSYRGTGYEIKYITLPRKYWDKVRVEEDRKSRIEQARATRQEKKGTHKVPYYAVWDGEDYMYTGFNARSLFTVKWAMLDLIESDTEQEDFDKFKKMSAPEIAATKGWTLHKSDTPMTYVDDIIKEINSFTIKKES